MSSSSLRARPRPSTLRRASLVFGAALAAAGLGACAHLPWSPAGGTCREAWADRPDREVLYDLARDGERTERGNEGYAEYAKRVDRKACKKRWDVLVYVDDAREGAEARAAKLLAELEAPFAESWRTAGSTLDADVLAEVALAGGGRRLHLVRGPGGDAAPTRLAGLASPVVAHVPSDAGDAAARLERFVRWAVTEYPAEEHLVVLAGAEPELAAAAKALARATAANGARPFAIVLAPGPGSASVERAVELAPAARYLIGGETEVGVAGVSARALIPWLNGAAQKASGDAVSARAIATLFPKLVREAVGEGGAAAAVPGAAEGYAATTLDTAATDGVLRPALERLGRALVGYVREDELRKIDLAYAAGPNGPPTLPGAQRDLGVLLARLDAALDREEDHAASATLAEARAAIGGVRAALGEAVAERRFGTGNDPDTAGATTWVPEDRAGYEAGAEAFARTRLATELGRVATSTTAGAPTRDAWTAWIDASLP